MSFLAVDLALFELLTGAPLDSQGRPMVDGDGVPLNRSAVLGPEQGGGAGPSYGVRIPLLKGPQREFPGLSRKTPDALRLFDEGMEPEAFQQVAVFDENIEGRAWENVWPCVTFRYTDQAFDPSVYVFHDPFQTATGAKVDITNRTGDVVQSGTVEVALRRHPESWTPTYMIRVYSKNRTELMLIEHSIKTLLPARTGLFIAQADGTSQCVDVLFEGYENLDQMGSELAMRETPQEQRYLSRAFLYRIEAYEDNTRNAFGTRDISYQRAIWQRLLAMNEVQAAVVGTYEDANKQEKSDVVL